MYQSSKVNHTITNFDLNKTSLWNWKEQDYFFYEWMNHSSYEAQQITKSNQKKNGTKY